MTQSQTLKRRLRGPSPRGDFEDAKSFAIASEDARIAADKKKTEALREVRLRKRGESQDAKAN